MKSPQNKPLRNLGIYRLREKTLILVKRSEELSFLFSEQSWKFHGPVDYRVSHGEIYRRGELTTWTDEDLLDTGMSTYWRTLAPMYNLSPAEPASSSKE